MKWYLTLVSPRLRKKIKGLDHPLGHVLGRGRFHICPVRADMESAPTVWTKQ